MNIILLGPPGAGKGTQAVMLKEKLNFLHLSTGDILRTNVKNETETGKEAKSFMDKGELVPDTLVIDMMLQEIKNIGSTKNFILDGFPRNLNQAKELDEALSNMNLAIDKVIYFKTSTDTIIKRLTGRRICKKCNGNYHIVNMPPKQENICDKCGSELYKRKDDNEETIKNRIEVYDSETKILVDYYRDKDVLEEVSGDLEARESYKIVFQIVDKMLVTK